MRTVAPASGSLNWRSQMSRDGLDGLFGLIFVLVHRSVLCAGCMVWAVVSRFLTPSAAAACHIVERLGRRASSSSGYAGRSLSHGRVSIPSHVMIGGDTAFAQNVPAQICGIAAVMASALSSIFHLTLQNHNLGS